MLDPSPLVLVPAALALWRFFHAFARLRRRGRADHAGAGRAVLFCAGVALAAVPLVSPLGAAADSSLPAHMLEHTLIADAAPALVLVALRGPLLFFFLPAAAVGVVARRSRLRAAARALGRPGFALALWAAVYAVWHLPRAYDAAVASGTLHALEHVSFVTAGVFLWLQLVDPARQGAPAGTRLALAGSIFVAGQILGSVLLLAPRPLFPAYAGGASALGDQQLAGVVMMVEQIASLGTWTVLLGLAWFRRVAPPPPPLAPAR